MSDPVASQVMNEIVEEVGKSFSSSIRPFLTFWKNLSHLASILTTAWTLAVVFFGSIVSESPQVWLCVSWMFACFATFMALSALLWLVEDDPRPGSIRRHG